MEIGWTVSIKTNFSIQTWGENSVVYNAMSGQTHLLNALAGEVLQLIQESPSTVSALISKLCRSYEVEDKDDLQKQIQKLISEFEILGLIEPIECES